jgi:hypothetical protein
MKLTAQSLANTFASTGAMLWVGCVFIALLLPGLYQFGAGLLSLGNVGHYDLTITNAILGGVLFTGISWVCGYVFGSNLQRFAKK